MLLSSDLLKNPKLFDEWFVFYFITDEGLIFEQLYFSLNMMGFC